MTGFIMGSYVFVKQKLRFSTAVLSAQATRSL